MLRARGYRSFLVVMMVVLIIAAVSGCSKNTNKPGAGTIDWDNHDQRAEQFVLALVNGDFSEAAEGFNAEMRQALSVIDLEKAWEDTIANAGAYISIEEVTMDPHDEYDIYQVISNHQRFKVNSRIVFSEDGLVAGLFFSFVENPDAGRLTPTRGEGYTEIPVIVGQGTDYPLMGIIAMPDNLSEKATAVVLVHGSGPQDMNSTAFGIPVFLDIADYLAQNGIAVLRYNKRTYAHGADLVAHYGDDLTVREETIDDALLAKALLAQEESIDENRIFLLGHSLGGMLAPRIVAEGDFAGGIIMAGSPRSLLDIIYDQNLYSIAQMDISEEEKAVLLAQVEEARADYFTLPWIYINEMDEHPAADYLTETEKPFLILHGAKDFQVTTEADFALYQEIASDRPNIELRQYDQLNHLFTPSTMTNPTTDDYIPGTPVDTQPLADIVAWLKARF